MNKEYSIRDIKNEYIKRKSRKVMFIILLSLFSLLLVFISLFIGTSSLSFKDTFLGLFNASSNDAANLIVSKIRLPRALASFLVGASLGLAGLIMQTNLKNDMASPSTLGVSNAAVLGANIAIIILTGGVVNTKGGTTFDVSNPYFVSFIAFLFSMLAVVVMLLLSKTKHFSPTSIILIGVALSAIFQAVTTLIQYFATDVRLTSAVFWAFGDLERGSMLHNLIVLIVLVVSIVLVMLFSKNYNAMALGDDVSKTLGVNVNLTRFLSLIIASLLTAVSISIYGIIGFIGLMAPHIARRLVGNNHKILIPTSILTGAIILEVSDLISRVLLSGFALPVGAITSLIGAPFFLYIIFIKDRRKY
ncbi:MAG: iron ABC transporter permease [Gammaproteobacteria bacterium]|nr:iron ABC transporter permease [Gammaproteobacteria bacterium]